MYQKETRAIEITVKPFYLEEQSEPDDSHFVFMATANGTVKKTELSQFSRPRPSGLIALVLEEGNTLVGAAITDGHCDVLLTSSSGKAARFKESDVRAMGRAARGVRGIRLRGGHQVISLIIPSDDGLVLTASANGYSGTASTDGYTGTAGTNGNTGTTGANGDTGTGRRGRRVPDTAGNNHSPWTGGSSRGWSPGGQVQAAAVSLD